MKNKTKGPKKGSAVKRLINRLDSLQLKKNSYFSKLDMDTRYTSYTTGEFWGFILRMEKAGLITRTDTVDGFGNRIFRANSRLGRETIINALYI